MTETLSTLAYLHGKPKTKGILKAEPTHFFVSETLNFTPKGEGEHFLVRIRKIGENTKYVANELAKACGVPSRDVSWAGLKDRHAITEQWFSVHLAGKPDPDLTHFVESHSGIDAILATTRHDKKLRPGDLIGNHFRLTLSALEANDDLEARLHMIQAKGVPNYFGEQRFGRDGNNIIAAREWGQDKFRVKDKSKRSFYLSAARAHLFNLVLNERIKQDLCEQPMQGDLLISHSHELSLVDDVAKAKALLTTKEWQISAPLTGDNALPTQDKAQSFEQGILEQEPDLLKVIRNNRMQHDRRALLLMPQQMKWEIQPEQLTIEFSLPAGCFATAVIREVMENLSDGEHHAHIDQ